MSRLTDALARIDRYVQIYCQTSTNKVFRLAPGLSQIEIEEIVERQTRISNCSHPVKFSQEIYELYQWHNGDINYYPEADSENLIEYVSFLQPEISFWELKDVVVGSEIYLFLDEGGGYFVKGTNEPHQTSPVFDELGGQISSCLTDLMQDIADCLDMTLSLLYKKGNFEGEKQERLESWHEIIEYFLEKDRGRYRWALDLLDIQFFLNAALNVDGRIPF